MDKFVVKTIERVNSNIIDEYKALDVSTVYEAQGKVGLISREIRPLQEDSFICGPAVTVVCYAGDNLMIHAAIEVCRPGDILVVTTIGDSGAGMIGELIVMALQKRGVQGLIIDAGVRDVSRIKELGFPVWSKAISSEGTTKNRGGAVNSDAILGECLIQPGDLILADDDGIVNVKKTDIDLSLELSKNRLLKEERIKEKINRGELSLDFHDLREVLDSENVVYYNSVHELIK